MNAGAIGTTILVVCAALTLGLQVRKQVADQAAAKLRAAQKLRRDLLVEGYNKRSAEVALVVTRVVDLLNDALGQPQPAVDRQLNRATQILTDAQEGKPDEYAATISTASN